MLDPVAVPKHDLHLPPRAIAIVAAGDHDMGRPRLESGRQRPHVEIVDLADTVTPNLTAFRSWVAKLVTDVVRDDLDAIPSYLLHCERSSGQYLFDVLVDAGADHGLDVTGFVNGWSS